MTAAFSCGLTCARTWVIPTSRATFSAALWRSPVSSIVLSPIRCSDSIAFRESGLIWSADGDRAKRRQRAICESSRDHDFRLA